MSWPWHPDDKDHFKKYKVTFYDRHSEHDHDHLCDHGKAQTMYPGDTYKANIIMDSTVYAGVEIRFHEDGKMDVILNHLNYIIEKRIREGIERGKAS